MFLLVCCHMFASESVCQSVSPCLQTGNGGLGLCCGGGCLLGRTNSIFRVSADGKGGTPRDQVHFFGKIIQGDGLLRTPQSGQPLLVRPTQVAAGCRRAQKPEKSENMFGLAPVLSLSRSLRRDGRVGCTRPRTTSPGGGEPLQRGYAYVCVADREGERACESAADLI